MAPPTVPRSRARSVYFIPVSSIDEAGECCVGLLPVWVMVSLNEPIPWIVTVPLAEVQPPLLKVKAPVKGPHVLDLPFTSMTVVFSFVTVSAYELEQITGLLPVPFFSV